MEDYEYFLELLEKASKRENVEIHAYCLMPNHFHLLLIPKEPNSLSKLMQWVMTSHVRYYHKKNKTSGHVWQVETATKYGMLSTLNERGRPRKDV